MDDRIALIHAAPLRCFAPHATTRFVERPDVEYVITPGLADGSYNEVSRFTHEERDAEAAIDAVIDAYRSQGLPFKWVVGPGSAPADLVARLSARGLEHWRARGMCARPGDLELAPAPAVTAAPITPDEVYRFDMFAG